MEMSSLFELKWAVDQDGYDVEHIPYKPGPTLLQTGYEHDAIRPRGGPLRWYRPMEQPSLWRRFAGCVDASSLLLFIQEFGTLSSVEGVPPERVDENLKISELVRQISAKIDACEYVEAAGLWNERARPHATAELVPTQRYGRFELRPIARTLRGAILLQTGEAIARNQQWRHCRNDYCLEWFQIGDGAHTSRREFCTDRCRVAWGRRNKQNSRPKLNSPTTHSERIVR
jgi:hypothetical protein